jgi:hypothetical protein
VETGRRKMRVPEDNATGTSAIFWKTI